MSEQLVEEAKRKACNAAIDAHITSDTTIIGIGSGSTILVKEKKVHVTACIPTSFQANSSYLKAKLPLAELNSYPEIDVAFDGADEVDSQLNCIKGGGGCHFKKSWSRPLQKSLYWSPITERTALFLARRFVLYSSLWKTHFYLQWTKGVPIEVIPMAYVSIEKKITALGGKPTLRMAVKKAGPVVTDNGNLIIDADFGQIKDPQGLHLSLIQIPGIVETGLFCGMASVAYFGCADGSVKFTLALMHIFKIPLFNCCKCWSTIMQ
ncbi:ribose 5-phosphate isomerase A-domain-containing protein [Chytridium lagenaria]|nr:ribose 5-phosphate isomerase A-domain-containing protein [Chytridium lagenaria]